MVHPLPDPDLLTTSNSSTVGMDMMGSGARKSSNQGGSSLDTMLTIDNSVTIRVGSPPQWLNVLVSTQSRETWVVGIGGCDRSETFDSPPLIMASVTDNPSKHVQLTEEEKRDAI